MVFHVRLVGAGQLFVLEVFVGLVPGWLKKYCDSQGA